MKHITKIEHKNTRGYWVRFIRNKVNEKQKFFPYLTYGSKTKALEAAIKWRDENEKTVSKALYAGSKRRGLRDAKPRANNTSGTVGVHPRTRRGELIAWVATWAEGDKRRDGKRKEFSISRYGDGRAYKKACSHRERMEKLHYTGAVSRR
jgi:hypothetical protein